MNLYRVITTKIQDGRRDGASEVVLVASPPAVRREALAQFTQLAGPMSDQGCRVKVIPAEAYAPPTDGRRFALALLGV